MFKRKGLIALMLLLAIVAGCTAMKISSKPVAYTASTQFDDGLFRNNPAIPELGIGGLPNMLYRYIAEESIDQEPNTQLPIESLSTADIQSWPNDSFSLVKLGHSTILLKIDGQLWLIDPVFSERASPFTKLGPKRFHPSPISVEELPKLDGVLISHNHYDHLDRRSIIALKDKAATFIVSLGLAKKISKWGVAKDKISELDWWQSKQFGSIKITATPAQHFSGRGLFDRNHTLWNSWTLNAEQADIFYSGDSGYFAGFSEIGERLGPFDLTLLEVGAYDKAWPMVHMLPEQAIRAHQDLRGDVLIPVHNGTFDLAFHPWHEPLQRMADLGQQHQVNVSTPRFGQIYNRKTVELTKELWWRANWQLSDTR